MKMTIALLILLGVAYATDRAKSIIHVSHLSTTAIAVTCANGADPTGRKDGDAVIMSCSYGGH